jgi:hypothetical protein
MRMTMYKNKDGGAEMISRDRALDEIRELGHQFAVSLAELGHDTNDNSDLMSGLAAYHMLKLEGVNPRLDAAHRVVVKIITEGVRAAS